MKKMFLFPGSVSVGSASTFSPKLFGLMGERKLDLDPWSKNPFAELEEVRWDGRIESLPTDERVIVRASGELGYNWKELGSFCAQHGHLCFYDDRLVDAEGQLQPTEALIETATKFLGSK